MSHPNLVAFPSSRGHPLTNQAPGAAPPPESGGDAEMQPLIGQSRRLKATRNPNPYAGLRTKHGAMTGGLVSIQFSCIGVRTKLVNGGAEDDETRES